VAKAVAEECKVKNNAAYSWLRGRAFPNARQAKFMLNAITMNKVRGDDKHLSKGCEDLLTQRDALEETFGPNPPAPMTEGEMKEDLTPKHQVTNTNAILKLHDTIGFEPRKHLDWETRAEKPMRRYEKLSKKEWLEIQDSTQNLPEFLAVSRMLMPNGMYQKVLANKTSDKGIPCSQDAIKNYEKGTTKLGTCLPPTPTLNALLDILLPEESQKPLREKAHKILWRNRAQMAHLAYKNPELDSAQSIGKYDSHQPAEYFIEKLRRHAGGRLEDSPDWANNPPIETTPIERHYDYLKTIRRALGLTESQVALSTGYGEKTIINAENYSANTDLSKIREACLKYYLIKADEAPIIQSISREAYKALHDGPQRTKAEKVAAQKATAAGSQPPNNLFKC
jgi:transcriptional regulator with XRE-family HTH domain